MFCQNCGSELGAGQSFCGNCGSAAEHVGPSSSADVVSTGAAASVPGGDARKCPFCFETIKADAIKCRYCGSALTVGAAVGAALLGSNTPPAPGSAQQPGGNIVLNAPVARPGAEGAPSIVIQNVQSAPAGRGYAPIKSPGLAVLLSFIFVGLGQIYNGQIGKGVVMMIIQFVNFLLMFVVIGFFTGFALWVFGMVDAHTTAVKINAGGY